MVGSASSPCKPSPGGAGTIPGPFASFASLSLTKSPEQLFFLLLCIQIERWGGGEAGRGVALGPTATGL